MNKLLISTGAKNIKRHHAAHLSMPDQVVTISITQMICFTSLCSLIYIYSSPISTRNVSV